MDSILEGWSDEEILMTIRRAFGDDVEVTENNVRDLFEQALDLAGNL